MLQPSFHRGAPVPKFDRPFAAMIAACALLGSPGWGCTSGGKAVVSDPGVDFDTFAGTPDDAPHDPDTSDLAANDLASHDLVANDLTASDPGEDVSDRDVPATADRGITGDPGPDVPMDTGPDIPGPACDGASCDLVPVQEWAPDATRDVPVLDRFFRTSRHIRWYWAGCYTLLGVLDDGTRKELLLYDGYVSKDASGLVDFSVSQAGIDRVKQYVGFVNAFLEQGFSISGMVLSHYHADHTGDVPLFLYYLRQANPDKASFPIVTDYHTWRKANRPTPGSLDDFFSADQIAQMPSVASVVSDLIVYDDGAGGPSLATVQAEVAADYSANAAINSLGRAFASRFRIYNLASGQFTAADEFALGGFGLHAYRMDHAWVQIGDGHWRVNAFKIWRKGHASDGTALMMDSTNDPDFVTEDIETDHLFLSWIPTFFRDTADMLMGNNRTATATTVKNRIRFNPAYPGEHYIVPMHVDDIMATSYLTSFVCDARLHTTSGVWVSDGFLDGLWYDYYRPREPYSMPMVLMTDEESKRRVLPDHSYWATNYNTIAPSVDVLVCSTLAWDESPWYYTSRPQGPDVRVRFGLIKNRAGIELAEP